jgi:phosphate transport system permease protein
MTISVIFPLFWILYEIISLGLPVLLDNFPNFLVKTTRPPRDPTAGIYNAIYGSILSVLVAVVVGVPIGLLSGIYLGETKNNKYTEFVRFTANVLSGTPSIVAGLVIYAFYVRPLRDDGYGALGAGLALAILMLPTITRVTEDGIRTIPSIYREAGLALGIPQYRVTLSIVLRASLPIVMTGVMLGVARIAGETAPLLFTAGDTNFLPRIGRELNDPTATLPIKIFNYSLSAFPNWIAASWGMAFFLVFSI